MQVRPTKAIINLSNLTRNYEIIHSHNLSGKIIAVVKADAYGHGAVKVVEKLISLKPAPVCFAVATVEEISDLFKCFPELDFLVFEPFNIEFLKYLNEIDFTVTISSIDQLRQIEDSNVSKDVNFHLKIDTGMGRVGLRYDEINDFLPFLKQLNKAKIRGTYTHFSTSDEEDKSFTKIQDDRFKIVLHTLQENGIDTGLVHAANSGAIFDHSETHYNAIRAGISLYGYYKNKEVSKTLGLLPVMSIKSAISTINRFLKGDSVSYGRRMVLSEDSYIASVSLGYADGINRALSGKITFLINGIRYDQAGTITMDRIMIDLKNDFYPLGTEVTILDDNYDNESDAWKWCEMLSTIPYEITCAISKRVPRFYKD